MTVSPVQGVANADRIETNCDVPATQPNSWTAMPWRGGAPAGGGHVHGPMTGLCRGGRPAATERQLAARRPPVPQGAVKPSFACKERPSVLQTWRSCCGIQRVVIGLLECRFDNGTHDGAIESAVCMRGMTRQKTGFRRLSDSRLNHCIGNLHGRTQD